jgi:putative DNA primase/helicase
MVGTLAIVAATGTEALGFSAPEPCRVLVIDGEMESNETQQRYLSIAQSLNVQPTDNLVLVGADWQERGLSRLDTPEGQAAVEPFVADADLVVIDNRSTLFDPESEKDATAWQPAQDWLLGLRRRGKAVQLVHHSNRQGGARGHSKPEDVMNLLVKLTRPDDYRAEQGARFTVTFEKIRGAHGSAVASFTAQFTPTGWILEGDTGGTVAGKLREHLRLMDGIGERPKSATRAIKDAGVNKQQGLRTWKDWQSKGWIVKHPEGGWVLRDED